MPQIRVVFYKDRDGTVPALDWLESLPQKVQDKFRDRIDRLSEVGHELERPHAGYLRDGIHELRIRRGSVNYRLLYFFHRNVAAVLSHGLTKEKRVPPREIDRAIDRSATFSQNPENHSEEIEQ